MVIGHSHRDNVFNTGCTIPEILVNGALTCQRLPTGLVTWCSNFSNVAANMTPAPKAFPASIQSDIQCTMPYAGLGDASKAPGIG